jgi:hypothetical protein
MPLELARDIIATADETDAARHMACGGHSAVDDGTGRMVASHRVDDDSRR